MTENEDVEIDAQAFLTGEPEVVTRTRQDLISTTEAHDWPSPEMQARVTADLLTLVATVPYRGDDAAYTSEAWAMACAMMNPLVEQNRTLARLRQEFEAFRQAPTSKTVQ